MATEFVLAKNLDLDIVNFLSPINRSASMCTDFTAGTACYCTYSSYKGAMSLQKLHFKIFSQYDYGDN